MNRQLGIRSAARLCSIAALGCAFTLVQPPSIAQAQSGATALQGTSPDYSALYGSLGQENYLEAKKQADEHMRTAAPAERMKLSFCYGRILLGLGEKDAARQYLKTMKAGKLDAEGTQLMAVYEAWCGALEGKPEPGVKALEALLEKNAPNLATPEAADVLAMLYMAAGEKEKAKKAVDFGLNFIKYRTDLKHPYIEPLLRGRLASNIASPEAKKLYDTAEKLREEGKFAEAGQAFQQVRGSYPKSEWAPAAAFRIGQCFAGLGRDKQALDHWKAFVKEQPAGPWRGQAHVAVIDLVLEKQLDLAKATEHALEATAVLGKPLEKESEGSWREAAYDIHLRQGIIALVDGRYDAAVAALQQAHASPLAPRPSSLAPLLAAAATKSAILPDALASGERSTVIALSLGTIYNALADYGRAKVFFAWALNSKGRSEAHRSFAMLGMSRAMLGKCEGEKPFSLSWDRARAGYQASLKEYAKGPWHDQTLRELALLLEQIAAARNPLPTPANGRGAATVSPGEGSPNSNTAVTSANTPAAKGKPSSTAKTNSPAAALLAARCEALPYWTDLAKRFPNSPHAAEALYHIGLLATDAEKPDDALAAFTRLAEKHPNSRYAGEARIRLIDVQLERLFDLPTAQKHATAAVAWYEKVVASGQWPAELPSPAGERAAATVSPGEGSPQSPTAYQPLIPALFPAATFCTLKQLGYDIYIRAGLIEYLAAKGAETEPAPVPKAMAFFEKAKPLQPERTFVVVQGTIPTGIERLIEVAKTGKSLTPEIVRKGDDKAKLILMLADIYHEGQEWQQSLDLCTRVIQGIATRVTREQKSYAYFKRGRNHYCLGTEDFNPDAALDDYLTSVSVTSKAVWADKALFLAANIQWNHKQDAKSAVALWKRLCQTYPKSEEAARSGYFVAVVLQLSGRPKEATDAFQNLIQTQPGSVYAVTARRHLKEISATSDAGDLRAKASDSKESTRIEN